MPAAAVLVQPEPSRDTVSFRLRGGAIEVSVDERDFLGNAMQSLERRWTPQDAFEHSLVQTMAIIDLKLVRLDTIELRQLGAEIAEANAKRLPALDTLARYRTRLLKERWQAEYRLRAAIAQRCTNEAEPNPPPRGRQGMASGDTARALFETDNAKGDGLALNREQRRRLAAVQRKAA